MQPFHLKVPAGIECHVARHYIGAEVPWRGALGVGVPARENIARCRWVGRLSGLALVAPQVGLRGWCRAVAVGVEGDGAAPVLLVVGGNIKIPVLVFGYIVPLRFCAVEIKVF